MNQKYSILHLHKITVQALMKHNVKEDNAIVVADALIAAEIDGLGGHGLSRLISYCAQAASGKIDGHAAAIAEQVASAAVHIDANYGFAYPAMKLAIERLCDLAPKTGVAVASITRSHHCGAAGYHVEKLANQGLIGLCFANTPKAIAPWGGQKGLFGTNPIAFAAPRNEAPNLVIDLALSKVARGKIMMASHEKRSIPQGWALDSAGRPTTDPNAALSGTMLPLGDAKGSALVLMVEILAAALTASNFGFEASSFFEAKGKPPSVGQLLIAFAPGPLSCDQFSSRLEILINEILRQPNTRLPGDRRLISRQRTLREGLTITNEQYLQLQKLAGDL